MAVDINVLARIVRDSPGLRAKQGLDLVGRFATDGDDAALVPHGDGFLVICAEAIEPGFVASDPGAAGAAAVVTNVSDVRAMGGTPLAIVDTVVSPDRDHADRVLSGIAWASKLLGVPVVGGHLTIGGHAAVSAACTGVATRPLRAAHARPGDALIAAFCLEGEYRGELPYFTSLRTRAPDLQRTDGEALVEVAEAGLCHAARDVSMPGVAGSLLQMLEIARCGATLDIDRLPIPRGVPLERWLVTFPSFGFILAAPPESVAAACEVFTRRGLAASEVGTIDADLSLRLRADGRIATVWDLAREPLTGIG
jgi:uncharacterized protein